MIDSTLVPPNDSSETLIRIALLLLAIALLTAACAAPGAAPAPTASPPTAHAATAEDPPPSEPGEESHDPEAAEEEDEEANAAAEPAGAPADADSTDDSETAETSDDGDADESAEEEPEPGNRRVVLDTEYDDARVGEEGTSAIEAELGLVQDEALGAYVRSVALRLLRHAPSRVFDYEFKIVDQAAPNAFALPGGKIYVSRGLLALVTSEDELAGVLGHEITHAAERHASARLEYSKRLNPFTIGLLRVARIAAYGRDQERDADRGGQILAARAGYDPAAIAVFLRKLDASERYVVGWSRLPSFFATHPTSPERAAIAIDRAQQMEWSAIEGVSGDQPIGYYEMIDGLVLGDDPAGGLFDDENKFIHPELRFSLRFPPGWETMNEAQAVRGVSPRRDAYAELKVAGPGSKDLDEIVDEFLEKDPEGQSVRVRDRRALKVGSLDAIRIEGRAASPVGGLHATMTFVRHEDLVYRLTVVSIDGSRYRGRARAFAHSFRPLDEEGVRSLRVTRLRIARALEDETLQDLSERTRNELEVVFTGVLNGIYASTPLPRRTPIKIGIAEPYLPKAREAEDERSPAPSVDQDGTEPRADDDAGDESR